ncbi:DUF6481 family protein [Geminicoccus roseus]|uniref:DUF6481 family protein n=1 Tax=Geminicoccus roseus TaxID=404900 RepID=UPI0003F5665C
MDHMPNSKSVESKSVNFSDRANSSAEAKKALLERFRAKATANDPAAAERQAERVAIARAREARKAERDAAKRELQAQQEAEKARREAEIEAEKAAAAAEAELEAQRAVELAAAQKAARDARYAARKARK